MYYSELIDGSIEIAIEQLYTVHVLRQHVQINITAIMSVGTLLMLLRYLDFIFQS
jgi:hypothetical protein